MSEQAEPEWVLIGLDDVVARKQGMPNRIPIPKERFEGLADEGLKPDVLRKWIEDFLLTSEPGQSANWRRRNSELVTRLESYVDKVPMLDKANAAFQTNDFEKATKILKRITALDPEDHAAKLNLASALANQGDYKKAMKNFKAIRETYDDDPDYHLGVAQIHVAEGRTDEAIEELVIALERKPDHRPSMDALAKLGVLAAIYEDPRDAASLTYVRSDAVLDYLKERWGAEERDADYYLQQLTYHERERRYEVALAAAEAAIAAAKEPLETAELGRVANLRALGRLDDAVAAAEAYAAKASESAGAQVELARCLAKAGKTELADAAKQKALELEPGHQEALVLAFWPDDQEDIRQVQEAVPGLQKFADDHPDVAGAWRSLARAKLVTGPFEEALALFEKAVGMTPDDDDLRGEWWGELARDTRYEEILADAAKLGDMKARHWTLRWNEAEAYRGLEKLMEARACYMAINVDETLHLDIRKRAKRAVQELGSGAEQ
jgi:tetratricopeptide (TPR) repeat protein